MRIRVLVMLFVFQVCLGAPGPSSAPVTEHGNNQDRHGRLKYYPLSLRLRQNLEREIRHSSQHAPNSTRDSFTTAIPGVRLRYGAPSLSCNANLLFRLMRLQL
jgi:hypothetical protein